MFLCIKKAMNKQKEQMPVRYKQLGSGQGTDFYFERSLDLIFSPGCFTVEIEHTDNDVGLPVEYCGCEHYIVGTLMVTDNDAPTLSQDNRMIGQVLIFTSRNSKETKVYTRTYADGLWSKWSSLARTGMYDNISTPDELLATVDSLVDENTRAKEEEEEVIRSMVDINSRLGHNAGTTVLKASDLLPITWSNNLGVVNSTAYNTWVLPLYEGREYTAPGKAFFVSIRTCSVYPVVGEKPEMTLIPSSTFTATADMKYLVITVNMSKYDNSDYEITASGFGLVEGFEEMENKLKDTDTVITAIQTELSQTKRELNVCIGAKDRTIVLSSDNYDNIVWNGTKFVSATSPNYNGFVVPIYPGERIRYMVDHYANNLRTTTEYPTDGSSCFVRSRSELENDFIVQENEHYLFINNYAPNFTNYEVIAGKGSINVQLNNFRQLQSPLYGKTIVCFGDSLTEFNGIEGKGYGDYLAELSGAKVVRGGIGGTQLATRKEPVETIPDTDIAYQHAYGAVDISNLVKAWANNDWGIVDNAIAWLAENKNDNNSAVVDRLKANPIENTDIVIVFGGTNDLNNNTFGSPNDTDAIKNTCGGINQIIDSILSVKPNMTIYFFTPIPRMVIDTWCDDYRTDQSDDYGSLSFPSLVKRIKECVEYNHIPCCDMYNTIGINRKNIYTYADDGVHPNRGYSILANKMYSFIMANKIWS